MTPMGHGSISLHINTSNFPSIKRRQACIYKTLTSSDLYNFPFTKAIPREVKFKIFNLPCSCDKNALMEHFASFGVYVDKLQRFEGRCVRMDFARKAGRDHYSRNLIGESSTNSSTINRGTQKMFASDPRNSSIVSNRLFIGNLPWRVNDASLQQLFSAHGTVQGAEVVRDHINRSRGFGFVVMSTPAEVQRVIAVLNGCEIEGRPLRVSVACSQSTARR